MKYRGRVIYPGTIEGETLSTNMGISFYGGVNPETGVIEERGHELEGKSIAGKILIFPTGKGSTVGSYTILQLRYYGKEPLAIINAESEPITAVGCIIAEIPCIDHIPVKRIKSGIRVRFDSTKSLVEILE